MAVNQENLKRVTLFLSALCILSVTGLLSQAYSLKFSHYGPRQGLAGNQVNTVLQDKSGYMWYGTEKGLSRFDGYEFRTFDTRNIVTDSRILSLCISEEEKLWTGAQTGISCIEPHSMKARLFHFYSDRGHEKPLDSVRVIFEDKNGGIWAGTGDALVFFNEDRQRFEKIEVGNISAPGIFSIVEGEGTYIWISGGSRLIRYDTERRESLEIESSELSGKEEGEVFILSLKASRDGKLWIGTNNGLYIYEYTPGESFDKKHVRNLLSQEMVLDIFITPDEDLWLGTMNGLIRMQRRTGRFMRYSEDFESTYNLRGNAVYKLFMDRSGVFWGCTNRGINKFDWGKQRFRYIAVDSDTSVSFKERILTISSGERRVWLGTESGIKYYLYDDHDSGYLKELKASQLMKEPVSALFEDSRHRLWFSNMKGLFHYDLYSRKTRVIKTFDEGEVGENVNIIFEDTSGRIWLGTESGVSYIRETDGAVINIENRNGDSINVTALYESGNKEIYAGTSDSGLFLLNRQPRGGKIFFEHIATGDDSSHFRVNSISEDFDGKILVGTDKGLFCVNDKGYPVQVPYSEEELSSRVINFIIPVRNRMTHSNELWLGTETGLIRLNRNTGNLTDYREEDGLLSEFFTHAAINTDGNVFAGTVKGVTIFRAEEINPNLFAPEIVLASLKIMGKDREKPMPDSNGECLIKVSYDQGVISLKFAALNFSEPAKNRYSYKFDGTGERWIDLGTKRELTLFNLNPGDYRLEVVASNSDGIWNREGRTFLIEVTPPFWLTTTFKIAAVMIIIVLVLIIYNARIRMVRKQNRKLQELVEARTSELKTANEELEKLAQIDVLTKLLNRRAFFERAGRLFSMAERSKYPIAIIMVDVDYFKLYNDSYGHQAGDECLAEMGSVLNRSVKRSGDLVARYGGEEFIILLYNTDEEGAMKVAERVRKRLRKTDIGFDKSSISDRVTVSQGVAIVVPDEKFNIDIAILAADTALYQAKSSGRDCTFFFNEDSVVVKKSKKTD